MAYDYRGPFFLFAPTILTVQTRHLDQDPLKKKIPNFAKRYPVGGTRAGAGLVRRCRLGLWGAFRLVARQSPEDTFSQMATTLSDVQTRHVDAKAIGRA